MKNYNIILIMLMCSLATIKAQIVTIPDANLKLALTIYPRADLGNGINEIADTNGDGEIQYAEAEAVLGLFIGELNIFSLEGLQYFTNIEVFFCSQNGIGTVDVITAMPNLNYFDCSLNGIASIDVTQNPLLETLRCGANLISTVDVTQNPNLKELTIPGCLLSNLDVTQNPLLEVLWCNNNQLFSLNIQNNSNLEYLFSIENPNLQCIQVDNVTYANNQPNWHKDDTTIYSEDCNLSIAEQSLQNTIQLYPNPVQETLFINTEENITIKRVQMYNVLGKKLLDTSNPNQINISTLASGLLFVKIETNKGFVVKKVVKE